MSIETVPVTAKNRAILSNKKPRLADENRVSLGTIAVLMAAKTAKNHTANDNAT